MDKLLVLKTDLKSPKKFRKKFNEIIKILREERIVLNFNTEEIGDLLLSACRLNEFDMLSIESDKNILLPGKAIEWFKRKIIPNTIILKLDDEDVVRLLIFCIEITYKMFAGGTRATVTQKGFRERRRTFESILADQFIGKLGEIMVKKFIEKSFSTKIELDWEISTEIERYRNDIVNASANVSIKTSPSLAGVWAEADLYRDYGISVKCSVPQPTILQFFIEVCGFSRLLDFADDKIPSSDIRFKGYLEEMRKRIKGYKCGEFQTDLKGIICGYFKTSEYQPIAEGEELNYLGRVREKRFIVSLKELKYENKDWEKFLKDCSLIKE